MKKRIFAIVMAIIMVTTLIAGAIPAMAADDDLITVRVHYHREDGQYVDPDTDSAWEMWLWDEDGITTLEPPYAFEEIDGEMVATIQVKPGTCRIGYIVRLPGWASKDVEHDQHINITGVLSGTVDFYIESGVASQPSKEKMPTRETLCSTGGPEGKPEKFMVLGDDVEIGVVITKNRYDIADSDGNPRVVIQMSSELDYTPDLSTFKVYNTEGSVEIVKVMSHGQNYYLTLGETLELGVPYYVEFEGRSYSVTMPDYYSTEEFESLYTYTGSDLGATYSKEKTDLRLWAPKADKVVVNLYSNGDPAQQETPDKQVELTSDVNGTWVTTLEGDQNGVYYTYSVTRGEDVIEAIDPYARTAGVDGIRGMIIDLASTNPDGWENDKDPHYDNKITDAIIYELHVRDLSSNPNSGIKEEWRGKYLGLTQTGTVNSHGQPTGLDYIKDLGITHIHLLPVYDFGSVNESKLDTNPDQFNWGYDPVNYNIPEGSYSTDPYNGEVRVKEFKQMVKTLHDNGISVIMDVVYNHVYETARFSMNKIVPNYFSRPGSNGSGCGNDTASERLMVGKFIVESVKYWADEYHIDGFRFDLVGLLDVGTINSIVTEVHKTHPNVIFYGEGWQMSTVTTKPVTLATMFNSTKTPNFAFFSDTMRNTLKGGTFGGINPGYISGASANPSDMLKLFKGMPDWCKTPTQTINYISCHDNNTLFDHISIVKPDASLEDKAAMNKLGAAFYMIAQGVPFLQAGEEIMRSKPDASKPDGYNENSYNANDEVNSIKWDTLNNAMYENVHAYYKGLIAFRKAHPALRLTTADEVNSSVSVIEGTAANVLAYHVNGGVNGETAEGIVAIFNGNASASTVNLPEGEWNICVNKNEAGLLSLGKVSGSVTVDGVSAMILVKGELEMKPGMEPQTVDVTNWIIIVAVWVAVAALCSGAILLLMKKK